jgi:hypothetical protein
MRSWVLAAGLLAAAMSGRAMAADLGEGPPPDRYGSAYDDPRYADIYRYPDRRTSEGEPYARGPAYRYEEQRDYREPRRYSHGGNCVPREFIKRRLHEEGWSDFRDPEIRGEVAIVVARRPNGRPFELTVDRCSGEVVSVRNLRTYGPYAYGGPYRRY